MTLCLEKIPKARANGNKIIGQCPACAENGGDSHSVHLVVMPGGGWGCAAHQGDRQHNRRIAELIGSRDKVRFSLDTALPRTIPRPKRPGLLARIKSNYPGSLADLWESSATRCDENLDDAKAFLRLFPAEATLWIAPNVYATGEPEHAVYWRRRAEWEQETFTAPGTRIASATFKPGSYSRGDENVMGRPLVVIESDEIGAGKKYADRDEYCSLIRWLREACQWHLAAVIDTGGKSLHAWFRWPGLADVTQLGEHVEELGLDGQFKAASHPWRLPGVRREGSERRQQLFYLDLREAA